MNESRSLTGLATTALLVMVMLLFFHACSFPKIIVLNDPLSADEHVKLGRIYETQGKTDLAMQQYEAAVRRDPKSVTAYLLIGDLSFKTGKYNEAESAYEKAIKLEPDNGDILNNLCWVYLKQDRKIASAEEIIQKAMIMTPEHRGYYLDTLGVILLRLNRVHESISALQQAAMLIPADQSGNLAEVYTHLAEAYRKSGDEVRARDAEVEAASRRKR